MPISLTYIAIAALTFFGVDNATEVVEAAIIIATAAIALYGRWRAGGITVLGLRK